MVSGPKIMAIKKQEQKFSIFIPTRDSEGHIIQFLREYRKLGVEPLYIVDSRTRDRTRQLLHSNQARFLEFEPTGDYPEAGMIEFGAKNCNTDWVLRIDDDEFFSKSLLEWINNRGVYSNNQSWKISRREVFRVDSQFVFNRSIARYDDPSNPFFLNAQARFFNVNRVEFINQVHTPGIHNSHFFSFVPETAFIIHTNCLLMSFSERLSKLLKYEEIKPLSTWGSADGLLPELFDASQLNYNDEGLSEFQDLFAEIPIHENSISPRLSDDHFKAMREGISKKYSDTLNLRNCNWKRLTSADDFAAILYLPKYFWKPISQAFCSFGNDRLQELGVALWNYDKMFNHKKMLRQTNTK